MVILNMNTESRREIYKIEHFFSFFVSALHFSQVTFRWCCSWRDAHILLSSERKTEKWREGSGNWSEWRQLSWVHVIMFPGKGELYAVCAGFDRDEETQRPQTLIKFDRGTVAVKNSRNGIQVLDIIWRLIENIWTISGSFREVSGNSFQIPLF